MTDAANPLDNKEAIAQMGRELRESMSFLLSEFIRPTMQQAYSNTQTIGQLADNLSRTEAIADSNARAIEAEGEQIRELRESVEVLRDVADDTADETAPHESRISENERRFETLLAESRAERREYAQRFDAMQAEIRALGEQNRALLSALANTNGRVDSLEQAS